MKKRLLLLLTCVLTLFGVSYAAETLSFSENGANVSTNGYAVQDWTAGNIKYTSYANNPSAKSPTINVKKGTNVGGVAVNENTTDFLPKTISVSYTSGTVEIYIGTSGFTFTKSGDTSIISGGGTQIQCGKSYTSGTLINLSQYIPAGQESSYKYWLVKLTSGTSAASITNINVSYEKLANVEAPTTITISPNGGNISTTDKISISANGTEPTINYSIDVNSYNKTYTEPFTLSEGSHTVYVRASNNAGTKEASATFTVTSNSQGGDSQGGGTGNDDGGEVTFDFSNPSEFAEGTFKANTGTVVDHFGIENVQVDVVQGSGTSSGGELRFYNVKDFRCSANGGKNGHTFTISTLNGANIVKIEFTGTSIAMTASEGELSNYTWTGKTPSVTFTTNGQVIFTKIKVTYEALPTGPQPWESTFKESYEVAKGHEVELFGKTDEHPEMTYSYSSNDGGSIIITKDSRFENAEVIRGISAGTVNVKATWEDSEKWKGDETSFIVNVQIVEAPKTITFDPESGSTILTTDLITISADGIPAPTITYTLNGISMPYSKPFKLTDAGEFTIYVTAENSEGSVEAQATYTVEKPFIPGVGSEFELIETQNNFVEGKYYIIVSNVNSKVYAISTEEKSSKVLGVEVDLTDDIITVKDSKTVIFQPTFTDSKWIWNVVNESFEGKAFGKGSGNTDTAFGNPTTDNFKSSVDINTDGSAKIVFASNRMLRGYDGTNGPDFRVYDNTSNQPVFIYRLVEAKKPLMPVVTIGEEVLKDKGTKTVLSGTEVSYSCEGAETWTATYNGKTIKDNPFTITESGTLVVYGENEVGKGPEFTYTFIVDVKDEFQGVGSNFRQVLNNSNYRDNLEEGYYVIGRYYNGESNPVKVAMSVNQGNNNITSTENVKFTKLNSEVYGPSDCEALTPTANDVLVVYLEKNDEDQLGIRTVNLGDGFKSSQKYLCAPNEDGNTLTFVDDFTPVYITITSQNNANITFKAENPEKWVGTPQSGNYFNYQKSGNAVQLYKYFNQQIFDPEVEDVKLRLTETETSALPSFENAPELTYTVAQEEQVITLSDTEIQAVNPGEAVVTISWKESNDWFAGSVSFTVTVLPPMVDITDTFGFRYAKVRGKKDVGVLSQAVYYEGDGKVEYSVWENKYADPADPTLVPTTDVTIQEDGMIRPEDIRNAVVNKVYTVKATVAATDLYSDGEAYYTFVIEEPVEAPRGDCKDDFSDNSAGETGHWTEALPTSYSDDSYPAHSNITGIDYDIRASIFANNTLQLRGTQNTVKGLLKFKIPSGCKNITIGRGQTTGGTNPSGTITIGNKEEISFTLDKDYTFSVAGYGGEEIIIENTDPGNYALRISYLAYEIPNSPVPEAELSFDGVERYINVFEDETITLPELLHAEKLDFNELIFDIDEIDEDDDAETYQGYTITANNFKDIKVDINYPGVYTFRAEYNAEKLVKLGKLDKVENAKYLDGMAILRLNVFPRLNVLPSDDHDSSLAEDERTNAPEITLVESVEENGQETAVITLPSIESLENSFKYSTVKIVKVEIKHGNETTVYEGDDLNNIDSNVKFTEDGYVKYTVRYANTEAFQKESTVHVVLMPKTGVEREDNKLTLTPSNNGKLKYAFAYGYGKKEIKRRATEIPEEEWKTADGSHTFEDLDALKEEGVTAIFYKTEKNLNQNEDMVASNSVPTNPILSNEGIEVLEVVSVTLNMGVNTEEAFKTNTHNYSLSGIFSFTGTSETLEYGKDFTVTVTPKRDAEGWASTTNTDNLVDAYEEAFSKMQSGNGLITQYNSLETEYVDGFYTGVSNINVTGTNNSFTVSADLPCSGVYVVTVTTVEGSEFTFDTETGNTLEWTIYPNLQGTFGKDKGFNIEGYTFGDSTDNGGYYTISFPTDYDEFGANMICYIPGTYFVDGLTASSTGYVTPETDSDYVYFAPVDLSSMNEGEQDTANVANVYVSVTKNGASHQYVFVVNKSGNINESTGVEGIGSEDGEAEYFDLNGFKVNADRLEKGIYIKVQNGTATKVLVK